MMDALSVSLQVRLSLEPPAATSLRADVVFRVSTSILPCDLRSVGEWVVVRMRAHISTPPQPLRNATRADVVVVGDEAA